MSVDVQTSRRVDEVLRRVKRTFGDEAGVQVTNADLLDWINDGQVEIARETRYNRRKFATDVIKGVGWWPLKEMNLLSIEAVHYKGRTLEYVQQGQAELTLYQELAYKVAAGIADPVEAQLSGQPKLQGEPQFWTIDYSSENDHVPYTDPGYLTGDGGVDVGSPGIFVWPVPDKPAPKGLLISAVKAPDDVSDASDRLSIPNKYFNALVQYVLMCAYELDEDHGAAQVKREEYHNSLAGSDSTELEEQQRYYPTMTYIDEGW